MPEIIIEQIKSGTTEIFRINGYLDETGGDKLKLLCEKAISDGRKNFLFNFQNTPVINSSGLAMFLEIAVKIIDYKSGKISVTGLSKITKTAFHMIGLLELVSEYETEEQGIF
ncbi:MAG: STAS domain-containing protein [Candidatus Riflebacteria bacterium]|nr:STAS domain-containing protein [Candidatus Riflebacteria bacterium]